MQVARIGALQQSTLGYVSLDLRVGPPTLMHVMEGNTSYHIILGCPWLKAYKAIASTYHQCVKAVWRNKQVVIEAIEMPFDRAELHFAEAAPYCSKLLFFFLSLLCQTAKSLFFFFFLIASLPLAVSLFLFSFHLPFSQRQ